MIASMYKAKLVILKTDLEPVLKSIQRASCLMIEKQEESANQKIGIDGIISRTESSIKNVSKYVDKKPLFGDYIVSTYDEMENIDDKYQKLVDEVEEKINEKTQILLEIKSLKEEIKQYDAWTNLSVNLNQLSNTNHAIVHSGYIEQKYLEDFTSLMNENASYFEILGNVRSLKAVFFINYCSDDEIILNKIKNFGYNDFKLPNYDGSMHSYVLHLEKNIELLNEKVEKVDNFLKEKTSDLPKLKVYADHLLSRKAREESDYASTMETYIIDGWLPKDDVDKLKKAVEEVTPYYDLELLEPKDDEMAPTYTINNKIVTPFEGITNMFSVPTSKEIDPNPVMSFWYWIIFGMMMGDVGYGVLLLILGFLFIKLAHPRGGTLNLAKVLTYSSITTIFWGIVFNSYFGFSLSFYKAFVNPMNDSLPMLVLSIIVGFFHIITGLFMKMIRDVKDKDIFEMLGKDLSWIFILLGLLLAIMGTVFGLFPALKNIKIPSFISFIGLGMIILGVCFILLFGGHKKKKIIGKIFGGVLGLYDVTSYLGDILSYSRIMALIMSSASVAYVMNLLAGMVRTMIPIPFLGVLFSIIIYIVGHLFNLVLGLLSAYVHDCRLQYIEFYGKFFDGGGYLFKPLTIETKYINEIK